MRPISEKEIEKWANNQQKAEWEKHFTFDLEVPKNLKNKYESDKPLIDPLGSEISIDIPFRYGPACMSYWLKHKKHQWVVAIYCSDKSNFKRVYGNKGPDNKMVTCKLSPQNMLGFGRKRSFNTVLFFHNHPMSISSRVTDEDRLVAKERKQYAKQNDWNYIEFICVRGSFRVFDSHISTDFKSIRQYKSEFKELNKRDIISNLKFRWERNY